MSKKHLFLLNSVIIVTVLIAGFFLIKNNIGNKQTDNDQLDLSAMEQAISAKPVVSATDLTKENIDKYLGQFDTVIQQVEAVNYNTLQGVNTIAQLKRILGDIDGAIIAWEYANIIRPGNSLSFSNLAALYHFDLMEYDKAEEQYMISVANDTDDLPTIRNFFELYHYSLKDDVKAEDLLLESIAQNPEAADLYSLTGRFYTEIDNLPKAIEYYEKHLELNPENEAAQREIERLKEFL
jgi:tetratricopeptide (TPR) repeat protein